MTRIVTIVLLLAAIAAPAAAQAPEESIARALDRARQAGVPVELLESKIAEGRAKGVPMARIATAVERRLEALQRAGNAVDRRHQLNTAELGVAADALQAGVSDEALRTIAERAPRERRAVAIATLAQLVQLGQASDVALRNVTAALQRGPEALMNLPAQAAAAAGRRGPPAGVTGPANAGGQGRSGPPAGVPRGGRPGGL
jgi:hypothetical protein